MFTLDKLKPIFNQLETLDKGFIKNFMLQLSNAQKIMNFNSKLIENFYVEICTYRTKYNLKMNIRLIIFTNLALLTLIYSALPPNALILFSIFFYLNLNILFYLCTSKLTTGEKLERASLFIIILFYVGTMFIQFNQFGLTENSYSPVIQINLLMFCNMPFNFVNALCLSSVGYAILLVTTNFELQRKNAQIDIYSNFSLKSSYQTLQHMPIYDKKFDKENYYRILILSAIGVFLLSFYLYFINNLRLRSAFIRLGQGVQARKQVKSALKTQKRWIEAVMPSVVRDDYIEHLKEVKTENWVYIKSFDDVSILFADVIGFIPMSANKTALQIVIMLNDLFSRFDSICKYTNCEKIGTLGDSYYCISGCPHARPDHAFACVELGLGMCKVIKIFNSHHKENVNMRVGVHTGRVNAAVLGKQRFRFDAYGNDVIITTSVQSSGKPGKVHISDPVYEIVRKHYRFELGDPLEIQKESGHGIAGLMLKKYSMKTYFIDPKYSRMTEMSKSFHPPTRMPLFKDFKHDYAGEDDFEQLSDEAAAKKKLYFDKVNADISFLEGLKFDSNQEIMLFRNLPIKKWSLQFVDREIEWHYSIQRLKDNDRFTLESMKIAPFIDTMVCTAYSTIIYTAISVSLPLNVIFLCLFITMNFISLFLMVIMGWFCGVAKYKLITMLERKVFNVFHNEITRVFMYVYYTASPVIILFSCYYDCEKFLNDYSFTMEFFTVLFFSLILSPFYISVHYFIKITFTVILVLVCTFIFYQGSCGYIDVDISYNINSCLGMENITNFTFLVRIKSYFMLQLFVVLLTSILIIRELESSMRLSFYVARQTDVEREIADHEIRDSEELLFNIIPKYIFNRLNKNYNLNFANLTYACIIPNAGVAFASISNFFSKYYREDYKSGENALKLLHKLICMFDDLINQPHYKDVEKIKTINDCYMVASGLNQEEVANNETSEDHLVELMNFCFDVMHKLDEFNNDFIIGTDKFEIKIGYNFGSLFAGILGKNKPTYDIWGNTVNISSRMMTTGEPGQIQTTSHTVKLLLKHFKFSFRGKTFLKGKGFVNTFFCKTRSHSGDKSPAPSVSPVLLGSPTYDINPYDSQVTKLPDYREKSATTLEIRQSLMQYEKTKDKKAKKKPKTDSNFPKSYNLLSKSDILPTKSHILPSKSDILPTKSHILPSKSDILPTKSHILPSKSDMLTSKSHILPTKSHILTSKSEINPSKSDNTSQDKAHFNRRDVLKRITSSHR